MSCFILAVLIAGSAPAAQTLTISPASDRVVPAEVYSGVNYSGVHTNGFTFTTSGGTNEVDLQVTNLPPGVTVNISPAAYVPASAPPSPSTPGWASR